ncbi:MAG: hypothetical protein MHM6MM_000535 [Cercozoa sp. M6MM]
MEQIVRVLSQDAVLAPANVDTAAVSFSVGFDRAPESTVVVDTVALEADELDESTLTHFTVHNQKQNMRLLALPTLRSLRATPLLQDRVGTAQVASTSWWSGSDDEMQMMQRSFAQSGQATPVYSITPFSNVVECWANQFGRSAKARRLQTFYNLSCRNSILPYGQVKTPTWRSLARLPKSRVIVKLDPALLVDELDEHKKIPVSRLKQLMQQNSFEIPLQWSGDPVSGLPAPTAYDAWQLGMPVSSWSKARDCFPVVLVFDEALGGLPFFFTHVFGLTDSSEVAIPLDRSRPANKLRQCRPSALGSV